MKISIITAAFNEQLNLPILFDRLRSTLESSGMAWEWVIVDDHSEDATFETARKLSEREPRIRVFRLARNSGSHIAMLCGLTHARGDAAIVMAADLQDPPETIPELVQHWREGAQVVWAVRRSRPGEKATSLAFARFYYFIMRHFVGIKQMPASGADFYLIDRVVLDALKSFREKSISIMALITWMGFRQSKMLYDKQARLHGQSGWSFRKKLKLVVDSITSFSFLPVRIMSIAGSVFALTGFLYAGLIALRAFDGRPPEGWASLMVAILVIGGIQMLMIGTLGEYLWRTLEAARNRPLYVIEAFVDSAEGRSS